MPNNFLYNYYKQNFPMTILDIDPKPTKRNPREKLKTAPPFAHGVPPLPAITGDQSSDPPAEPSLTGFQTSSPQTLPNREFPIVERVNRSLHLPGNPNLTNRQHPTSPFTQSRRYSSHRATACVWSLPELTTPDGNWTELRQNELNRKRR
ncbi:hypothetical protein YC2023_002006 [Brassica napus]